MRISSKRRAQRPSTDKRDGAAPDCLVPCTDQQRVARGRSLLLDTTTSTAIADIFRALADPTRLRIVYSLLQEDLCTCDLAAMLATSNSAISQHLHTLRQLRLVKSRRAGRLVFYSLDDAHISLLLAVCLSHIRDGDQRHADVETLLGMFERLPVTGDAKHE